MNAVQQLKRFLVGRSENKSVAPKNPEIRLLAVTDAEADALSLISTDSQWNLTVVGGCEEAVRALSDRGFQIILCDRDLPGLDWREAMEALRRSAPHACVILMSHVNDDYLWEEVVQRGGYDVVAKPLRQGQVAHAIQSAWLYWKSGWAAAAGEHARRNTQGRVKR